MVQLAERFWSRVAKGLTPDDCWIWLWGVDKDGYGKFRARSVGQQRTHRIAWVLSNGPIPSGLQVLHSCDQPACVRPDHLWLGTHLQNHQDKARKGRSPTPWAKLHPELALRRTRHPNAKLTEAAVSDIRQNYRPRKVPLRHFAKKYNVGIGAVHWVVSGGTWNGTT